MKKLSLLILLALLLGGTAIAATFSGTVTDGSTSMPVASQMVYLTDTSGNLKDSMLTNVSGGYSFTPGFMVANGFQVSVTACGLTQHSSPLGSAGGTWNVTICGTPMHLWGGVFGNSPSMGQRQFINAKIYLIAVTAINSVTGDTTLTAVDSFVTNSQTTFDATVVVNTQWFINGMRLKGALQPSHPEYANFLPSYYGASVSSLNWRGALLIPANGEVDIELINGVNPGGPAFIGGSVLLGANKSAAIGDPLSKRILILTKSTGEAVAYTYSDASGHFSFPSLPLGTYNIFGDALGKSNPPLTITLSASNNHISNVVFEENDKTFKGHLNSLSVAGSRLLDAVTVFPNPASNFIFVQGLSNIPGEKTLILTDVTGEAISRQTITSGEPRISIATLPAGFYLLQVQTTEGTATFRVTK